MAPITRFHSAIQAMKSIGIPSKSAKPVLKNLLKVYENSWDLIEDESYRLLADAIFEWQESQEQDSRKSIVDKKMEGEEESFEYDVPVTRPRLRIEEPPSSPIAVLQLPYHDTLSKNPIVDDPPPLKRRPRSTLEEEPLDYPHASRPCLTYEEVSSSNQSISPQLITRWRGKHSEESYNISGNKRQKIESTDVEPFLASSNDPVFNLNRDSNAYGGQSEHCNPSSIWMPKSESFTDDFPEIVDEVPLCVLQPQCPTTHAETGIIDKVPIRVVQPQCPTTRVETEIVVDEVPISVVQPQSPSTHCKRNCVQNPCHSLEALATLYSDDEEEEELGNRDIIASSNDMNFETVSTSSDLMYYEIASTSLGEVKLALSCHSDGSGPIFHVPSLDAVLKLAEGRAQKCYKIHEPGFSMMKLMKDVCECFLELATDASKKHGNITTVTPLIDMLALKENNLFRTNGSVPCDLHSSLGRMLPHQQHIVLNCAEGLRRRGKADKSTHKDENLKQKETESFACKQNNELVLSGEDNVRFGTEKPLHDIYDISRGEEKIRIPIMNEVSSEPYPPSFHYIPTNHVFRNAHVNLSLAHIRVEDCCPGCFGDCLLESIPCACARETGGEYAYTLDGLVKKELLDDAIYVNRQPEKYGLLYCRNCPFERYKPDGSCKGHPFRRFIKECWSKCGCSKQCGNRVVQRGITTNLQVFLTPEGKGWGLRTLESLPRGAFVCEYVGEIVTIGEFFGRNAQSIRGENRNCSVPLDAGWGSDEVLKDEEALCLDATCYGNVARFINHRCFDATLVEIPVEIETPDHHYYHLAFFTTREVEALEELTWDYGLDFDDVDEADWKSFQCLCGSQICRDPRRRNRMKQLHLTLNGR